MLLGPNLLFFFFNTNIPSIQLLNFLKRKSVKIFEILVKILLNISFIVDAHKYASMFNNINFKK